MEGESVKKKGVLLLCITILSILLIGCANDQRVMDEKVLVADDITTIQVIIDFNGNPNGKNEAKHITDKSEILDMVNAFRNASLGKAIELIYGNSSVFRFMSGNDLVSEFVFTRNSLHAMYKDNACYETSFMKGDPWAYYEKSTAPIIFVDNKYNIIDNTLNILTE